MIRAVVPFVALSLLAALPCAAYSALSHEAVIDSLWKIQIVPLLQQKFPNATPDDLKRAHAYAYGGAQIQDMGYYPFGSHEFSDLAHYARSGDFVVAMIADAQTLEEYAFALGALAHYASDNTGHPAINRSTGRIYRKLGRKFGPVVTYEDNPTDHLRTEFSFDVIQASRGLYAPDDFHDFIGFEVSKPLLQRAFADTYGIQLTDVFGALDLGIGTYRFTLGRLLPEVTKIAWESKRAEIQKISPKLTRSHFVYALPRHEYEKAWGREYRRPGLFARFFAFVFRFIPAFGPFKILRFKAPPNAAERDFLQSFDATVADYRKLLESVKQGNLRFPNTNLDTGEPSRPNDYRLADQVYIKLLDQLAKQQFTNMKPDLRANLESYFAGIDQSKLSKKTLSELHELQQPAKVANRENVRPHLTSQ
jgi:Zinc dependent phospholipase C